MELGEILGDALVYPFQNIKAFVIYLILGIILGIAVAGTIAGMMVGVNADNLLIVIGSGIIGIIVAFFVWFFISGYELDIIKYGIERSSGAPEIDLVRQFVNGIKYFVVTLVYMIIPIIISAILAIIFQHWLSLILTIIVAVIFALALFMGQCRLAKTEDLVDALSIGEAIGDISKVGVVKLILFIVVITVISLALFVIVGFINRWNTVIGGILIGILGVYITFFTARATGLLYSDI